MGNLIDTITTAIGVGVLGYFGYVVLLPQVKQILQDMPSLLPPPPPLPTPTPTPAPTPLPPVSSPAEELLEEEITPPKRSTTSSAPKSTTPTPRQGTGPGTTTTPTATGGGVTDGKGIRWLYADGAITTIAQTRTDKDDHRWSGNVSGLGKLGMEATMIVDFTSASVKSGGHFAMKHGGPNHSGSGSSGGKWYDTGIRQNGAIQVQTEHPHPDNHTYSCSDVGGCSVSNIGKGMQGSIIGLKWVLQPSGNGNFIALYYDANALTGGRPTNAWKKVFSIVDTKLLPGWKPPDTQDCEIRISDTSGEKAYGGGLHVRKLTKPISTGGASFARAFFAKRFFAPPNFTNSRFPDRASNHNTILLQQKYRDYLNNYYYNKRGML